MCSLKYSFHTMQILKRISCVLLLFLSALAGADEKSSQYYQVAITAIPSTFDPAKSADTDSSMIIIQLFDNLFARDANGVVSPSIAEKYEISPDRKHYKFTIRKDAVFHDLKPIRAEDVKFSLLRKIRIAGTDDRGLDLIEGVKAFREKKAPSVKGLTVTADRVLEISLLRPYPGLLEILSDLRFGIVPKDFDQKLKQNKVIGSGPFCFEKQEGSFVQIRRFQNYWGKTSALPGAIFRVVKDYSEAKSYIEMGLLDNTHPFIFESPPNPTWAEYKYLHASVRYLGFNITHSPLSDENYRKALVSVLPLNAFRKRLSSGQTYPVSRFIPYGLPGYHDAPWAPPLDVKEAENYLRAHSTGQPIKILFYIPDPVLKQIAVDICTVWTSMGVRCELKSVNLAEFMASVKTHSNQIFIGKLMPHVPDTLQLLSYFRSDSPNNLFAVKDKSIDLLLDETQTTDSALEKSSLYGLINEKIHELYVAIPLQYMGQQRHFVRPIFKLPYINVSGPFFIRFSDIELKNE